MLGLRVCATTPGFCLLLGLTLDSLLTSLDFSSAEPPTVRFFLPLDLLLYCSTLWLSDDLLPAFQNLDQVLLVMPLGALLALYPYLCLTLT